MIKNEKGQSLVEFALVIPILMLLLVGVVDLGRVVYSYSTLHFTAQETVRVASFGYTDSEITEFARENYTAGDSSKLQVSVDPPDGSRKSGEYVTVTLQYPAAPILPFADKVFSGPINLKSDSTIRVE